MDTTPHTLSTLFEQLGLPGDEASVDAFVGTHQPVADGVSLAEASFWTEGQAAFLREAIAEDSDWAELVDALDALLRAG